MTACYVIGDRPSHTHRRHWTGLGTRAQKDKQAKTCSCRFPHPPALPRFQSPPGLRHSRRPPFLDAHHVSNGRSRVSADFGFAPREAGPGTRHAPLLGEERILRHTRSHTATAPRGYRMDVPLFDIIAERAWLVASVVFAGARIACG